MRDYGWGYGDFAHVFGFIVYGLFALLSIAVTVAVIFFLVRFLIYGTKAAQLYIAKNAPAETAAAPAARAAAAPAPAPVAPAPAPSDNATTAVLPPVEVAPVEVPPADAAPKTAPKATPPITPPATKKPPVKKTPQPPVV